jgi:hypothetical protein
VCHDDASPSASWFAFQAAAFKMTSSRKVLFLEEFFDPVSNLFPCVSSEKCPDIPISGGVQADLTDQPFGRIQQRNVGHALFVLPPPRRF